MFVIPAKAGHVVQFFKPNGATISAIQLFQVIMDSRRRGSDAIFDFFSNRLVKK